MVFKSDNYGPAYYEQSTPKETPRVDSDLIAYLGSSTKQNPKRESGIAEKIYKIDDELLCYNVSPGFVLARIKSNDRRFDEYIKLPFTKGVTERESGRTMLIIGDLAHHGEAMQGQFDVTKNPYDGAGKAFGNTIRWINVGDTKKGFVGLDYRVNAQTNSGVARNQTDVKFIAETLLRYGYDPNKKLFLLEPPHIIESPQGRNYRRGHKLETLFEWSKIK